jgi:hypothetical protein
MTKPRTPRQAFIAALAALPEEARKEALHRIDQVAPRGPDDDDDYHSTPDDEFAAAQDAEMLEALEVDDEGNERRIDAAPVTISEHEGLGPEPTHEAPTPQTGPPRDIADKWVEGFAAPGLKAGYERINSPRYLLGNERYIYLPLSTDKAAEEADNLTSSTYGKALIGFALSCQRLASQVEEQYTIEDDDGSTRYDADAAYTQLVYYVQAAYETLLGEAGKDFRPFEVAFRWLQLCQVRRVPLPSNRSKVKEDRDNGGPIFEIKGPGEWRTYYRKREHSLVRLAGAIMWETLSPFCTLLQCTRD